MGQQPPSVPERRAFADTVTVLKAVSVNDQTEWAVVEAVDHNGEVIRLVGVRLRPFATPGRTIAVTGRWHDHPDHGPQVKVAHVRPAAAQADAPAEVLQTLRRVPHVGDKRAQLIVDRYGVEALHKVDENPRKALRAANLPHSHLLAAAKWWNDTRPLDALDDREQVRVSGAGAPGRRA